MLTSPPSSPDAPARAPSVPAPLPELSRPQIEAWLRESDPAALETLFTAADHTRARHVGDAVHLRALVEISNRCSRMCAYCGLRATNIALPRYRMGSEKILAAALLADKLGYGTIVMQSGEDPTIRRAWLIDVIRSIKAETSLAITLSLGERDESDLRAWKRAGADRYLLRFETSDADLFARIHPPRPGTAAVNRIALLRRLREFGYEIGSGIMLGIPGQTIASVADDIALFRDLDLDMIGIGPYIAHPDTPLAAAPPHPTDQAPAGEALIYKAIALARLVCPAANIPATTALATVNKTNGRELGLTRGGNVFMPNLTPQPYRSLYQIYPAKACIDESPADCDRCLRARITHIGRTIGKGPGGRSRSRRAPSPPPPGTRAASAPSPTGAP